MALGVDQLIKDLRREDVLADLITVAGLVGLTTTGWQHGEPVYDLLDVFSDRIAGLWNANVAPWMRSKYLDYASGDFLSLRAWTDFKRVRFGKTFATGVVVIENRGPGFYTITAGMLRVRNTEGKTFVNTSGGVLAAWSGSGAYPTLSMTWRADEAGAASTTPALDIPGHPTPLAKGFANLYAVPNVAAMVGADQEGEEALKTRCRLSTGPLSPAGPRSAYEACALDSLAVWAQSGLPTPNGWPAVPPNINRVRVVQLGGGELAVYVASPAGAASGDMVSEGSDVWTANLAIQVLANPSGFTVTTASAVEKAITKTVNLYVDRRANVTSTDAAQTARDAIVEWFKTVPIGGLKKTDGGVGKIFDDDVIAIAKSRISTVLGAAPFESAPGAYHAEISAGAGDVTLAINEVAVPTVIVNVLLVAQG